MDILNKYFDSFSETQRNQYSELQALYGDWNQKINVISRKDIDNLLERHILHSLAISKFIQFKPGTKIIDLGTGGGFPGVPLAIAFPDCEFHLVDSIRKKLTVVEEVSAAIGLENIRVSHSRVEDLKEKADFVTCRAVAKIDKLMRWTKNLYSNKMINAMPNGLLALKGGDLKMELRSLPKGSYYEKILLQHYYEEEFFEEKYLIYVQGA